MCLPITPINTKAPQNGGPCCGYRMSPARCADIVRKLCRGRKSEAYPCREKFHEFWWYFSCFWGANTLLAANLSDNPANLCGNRPFLGGNRPHDGVDIVLYGPFVQPCGMPREAACGLWKAQRQTFHGKVANLCDKSQTSYNGWAWGLLSMGSLKFRQWESDGANGEILYYNKLNGLCRRDAGVMPSAVAPLQSRASPLLLRRSDRE